MLRGAAHAAANEHGTARVGFGDSGRRLVTRSGGAKRRRLSTDAGGHRREGARHPCLHLPLHRWTSCMADEHPSRRQARRRRSATDSPCFPRFRRSITATGAATSRCRWHRSAPGAPRLRSSSRRPSSPRGLEHPDGVVTGASLRHGVQRRHIHEPVLAGFPEASTDSHHALPSAECTCDPLATLLGSPRIALRCS